jgi:hypothetical protein
MKSYSLVEWLAASLILGLLIAVHWLAYRVERSRWLKTRRRPPEPEPTRPRPRQNGFDEPVPVPYPSARVV